MSLEEQPTLVLDRLFIGNISQAASILQGGDAKITHILSLLGSASISFFSEWRPDLSMQSKEIQKVYVDDDNSLKTFSESNMSLDNEGKLLYLLEYAGPELNLVRMAAPLRDMENENLLGYLDACLDFIDKGRKEGAVLVHCFAGVSRSAAVVTAYLMRTECLKQEDALDALQLMYNIACPNDGFLNQLKMFEDMGFIVDRDSRVYKQFHLKQLGISYERENKISPSRFAADPGLSQLTSAPNAYHCKRCRRVVATEGNIVTHTPGENDGYISQKWRSNDRHQLGEAECSSLFLEPLKWMAGAEGAPEGKLFCVKCEARLGSFNWSGIECSCGSWITPAFQLHKSRVDHNTL